MADLLDIAKLKDLLDADLPITDIASALGVSRQTIYNKMKTHGLQRLQYADISDDDLVQVIIEVKRNHPNDGEILIDGHLKARSPPIKVQRWRLRAAIHFVDEDGVKARKSVSIKRRQYSVPCPHYLWHVDGNHKLIKWKMVIHGGIDGFTRMVVFLNVANNNRAITVHTGFCAATEQFQWPIRIRTDYGGENEDIWRTMIERRGPKSALVGSSVHNQPIEQLWGLINDRVSLPFKNLFHQLERGGYLNTDNTTDIACLHWVFLPLIQANLTREALALNKRKISTEHNRTPCQLEAEFIHLTAPYEGRAIAEHEGVDWAYGDPDQLARPLKHVYLDCFDNQFPEDLCAELTELGTASTIEEGGKLYLDVVSAVEQYILRN